jgi:hypothetical protein
MPPGAASKAEYRRGQNAVNSARTDDSEQAADMRRQLRLHPDSRSAAVASIDVEIARPRVGGLELSYLVAGNMSSVRMPPTAKSARVDGLWRHTCFEAFVRATPDAEYYELNFSPSGQWATYLFSNYRRGMGVAEEIDSVRIKTRVSADGCVLRAWLNPDEFRALPKDRPWHLGLSAVIEDASGGASYWALAHPPGKPDFHHSDGFACEFSPAVTP